MNDRRSADDWFPLDELTGRLAGLAWAEGRIASILDSWSRVEADDAVCALFACTSRHHAWHAETLTGCLPTSRSLTGLAVPQPPGARWQPVVEVLETLVEPERTVTRLAAIVREVDPWFARETAALVACARPVADASVLRWMRFVELDHHDDAESMAALLQARAGNTVDLRDHALLSSLELTMPATPPALPD